jgi:hypothetical protein
MVGSLSLWLATRKHGGPGRGIRLLDRAIMRQISPLHSEDAVAGRMQEAADPCRILTILSSQSQPNLLKRGSLRRNQGLLEQAVKGNARCLVLMSLCPESGIDPPEKHFCTQL